MRVLENWAEGDLPTVDSSVTFVVDGALHRGNVVAIVPAGESVEESWLVMFEDLQEQIAARYRKIPNIHSRLQMIPYLPEDDSVMAPSAIILDDGVLSLSAEEIETIDSMDFDPEQHARAIRDRRILVQHYIRARFYVRRIIPRGIAQGLSYLSHT